MIIRKYIANTVEEAQTVIVEELGPKATVLTMRYIKQSGWRAWFAADRVEVTAAVDKEDLEAYTSQRIAPVSPQPQEESSSASLNDNLAALKASILEDVDLAPVEEPPSQATYSDPRLTRSKEPEAVAPKVVTPKKDVSQQRAMRKLASLRRELPSPEEKKPEPKAFTQLGKELIEEFTTDNAPKTAGQGDVERLDAMRKIIREELSGVRSGTATGQDTRFLTGKGVDSQLAQLFDAEVTEALKERHFDSSKEERTARLNRLMRAIASRIHTTGPLQMSAARRPAIVAIVGPTGVGKTTTLTKIAGHYANRGYKVSVISIDNVKVGAREQIRALAQKFALELTVATDALELRAAVATHRDADLILIDTAGQSQYHTNEVEALASVLTSVSGLQILLALSATTKDIDSYGSAQQFACMNIDSLIVTKLDETIAHGLLVNICEKTHLPLRYLTTGQCLEEDLEVADALSIARSLLLEHNEKRFDKVRKMAAVVV
jgi:flagellar biosynthesis protein FlhF